MNLWIRIKIAFRKMSALSSRLWDIASIQDVQEKLLNTQVLIGAIVGIFVYVLALIPAVKKGLYSIIIIYTLFFFWIIIIATFRKLPYLLRARSWLIFLFSFGVINLLLSGLNIDAGIFFLAFIIMTSLLISLRSGFLAFFVCCLAIILRGLFVVNLKSNLFLGLTQSDPFLWIIGGTLFLILGFLMLLTVSLVMQGLINNVVKATSLAEELQKAHEKLFTSEIRFRSLIEYSTDLIAVLSEKGEINYASPSSGQLLGYKPDEVIGTNILSYLHTQDYALAIAALTPGVPQEVIGDPVEVRLQKKDGSWRYFEVNGFELRSNPVINGTVINARDITERKKMENLLKQAKENLEQQVLKRTAELQSAKAQLEELVAHSPAVIYSSIDSGNWEKMRVSENVVNLLGFSSNSFSDEKNFWKKHIHPEDRTRILKFKQQTSIDARTSCQYRIQHLDGKYRYIRDDMQIIQSSKGKSEIVGSWIDVTKQVESEKATQKSMESYQRLYETMIDAFVRTDMAGRIKEVNRSYCDLTGYSPRELHKLTYKDLTPKKWHEMEDSIVKDQILTIGFSDVYEKEYVHKNGKVIPVELRTSLTKDENGNPESMWAIVRDITGRKENEAIIIHIKEELERRVEERTLELTESQDQLRKLTREIITTQEEERRSVSRELHDEAGQLFVTLKHNLDLAINELPERSQGIKDRLESAQSLVDQSMQVMRSISHRLRPPGLEIGGINISLEDLCQEVMDNTNIKIDYQGEDIPGLPNEIAISIYRVVQESLTNILKHAQAKKAIVKLKYISGMIQVNIKDDGRGISRRTKGGTGLLGLRERLRLLGGEIRVASKLGKGVHLTALIPWETDQLTVDK